MKGAVFLLLAQALAFVICAKTMEGGVITSSSTWFLTKGQFSLTCNYETVNTRLPVTYAWYKNNQLLPGNTTKTIFFNDPTSNDAQGQFTCTVTRGSETVTSQALDMQVFPLKAISTYGNRIVPKYAAFLIGRTNILSCDGQFSAPGMVYEWQVDNTVQKNQESKTFAYTPKAPGEVEIKCKYTYEGQTSTEVKKTIKPTYFASVSLLLNNKLVNEISPVEGSKVRIKCLPSENSRIASFSWSVDSRPVKSESSSYYEFTAGKAGSPKTTITCQVDVKGTSKKISTSVTPVDSPLRAGIKIISNYVKGATADLSCFSKSYAEGATFTWWKDYVVIQGATGYLYHISKLSESDEGSYTCSITVQGQTSTPSDPRNIKLIPDEITCTFASECAEAPNTDKTICDNGKCRCLEGYRVKNLQCSSGAVIMGSFVMILSVLLTQNLF